MASPSAQRRRAYLRLCVSETCRGAFCPLLCLSFAARLSQRHPGTCNAQQVVPTLTRSKAWECTLAAHSHDFSTIAIVTKASAEEFCMKLQKEGLTISVAPDSNFKKDGEGGEGGGPQSGKK